MPSWVRPDLHRLPTLRIHPSAGIHPVPPPNVYVDPTPVWWPGHPLVTRLMRDQVPWQPEHVTKPINT